MTLIAVFPKDSKQVYRRLCARHIRLRKLRGYWNWKLQGFDVPDDAIPVIHDLIVADPDTVAGCTWIGRPLGETECAVCSLPK